VKDVDVTAESRTDIEIHFVTRSWRIRVELVKKEATDKLGIERAVDKGGKSFQSQRVPSL
jgi:hypothetical protein